MHKNRLKSSGWRRENFDLLHHISECEGFFTNPAILNDAYFESMN